ncbi:MAG TPA: chemotaxis protein CheX [Polyangiaceae bacterium]|jgi:chemotaxis protein CheX|nr:chemotaxis protein CheX [Polyangiaceae bacterium]
MYREELTQIAQTIWESVLQMPLEPAAEDSAIREPATLIATIGFSGAWEGEVRAILSEALGRRMAGAMLDSEPDALAHEDVLDAVGEIINMLGGNVKALLPPPCQLSLPSVSSQPVAPAAPEWVKEALHFSCQRHPIEIVLRAAPMHAETI